MIGFFIVTVVLSNTLYKISLDRHLKSTITEVLISSLAQLPHKNFVRMVYQREDDMIHVLAYVDSASVISPTQVSRIQQNLTESLDTPVELIVQSNVARTVGALDSLNQVNAMNLDGDFINKELHPRVVKSKQADTIIRNTYRVLMTRGLKGCYVFCTDAALAQHLRSLLPNDHAVAEQTPPIAAEDSPRD